MFFFDVGVERQLNSTTEAQCNKNFEISCAICCRKGYNVQCDSCPIASANEQQKAIILDMRKAERHLKQKRAETERKINSLIKTATDIYACFFSVQDFETHANELEKLADEFLKIKEVVCEV